MKINDSIIHSIKQQCTRDMDTHLRPCQTTLMELFAKIVNDF